MDDTFPKFFPTNAHNEVAYIVYMSKEDIGTQIWHHGGIYKHGIPLDEMKGRPELTLEQARSLLGNPERAKLAFEGKLPSNETASLTPPPPHSIPITRANSTCFFWLTTNQAGELQLWASTTQPKKDRDGSHLLTLTSTAMNFIALPISASEAEKLRPFVNFEAISFQAKML